MYDLELVAIPTDWANIVGILFCLTIKNPLVNLLNPFNPLFSIPSITDPLKLNFKPIGFISELSLNTFFSVFILNIPFAFSGLFTLLPSII